MKTPEEWMKIHGYESGVCCGHGDYRDLPNRLTPELVAAIQADAKGCTPKCETKDSTYRGDYY